MISLGQRIREYRLKKGMTQIDLSKGLCTPSMISQIESDRARPSYKALFAIAERLEVPLENLLIDVDLNLEYKSKYTLASALCEAKQFAAAIALFEELLQSPRAEVSPCHILNKLGECYLQIGQAERAEAMFNQVLERSLEQEDHELMAAVLLKMGQIAAQKKEYPIGLYYSNRALEVLQRSDALDPQLKAQVLYQIAALYQEIGKIEEATRHYEAALQLFADMTDLEGTSNIYLRLAETYQRQENYEKSQAYAAQALSILQALGQVDLYRDLKRQMILLKANENEWEQSVEQLFQLASVYEEERGDKERAGDIYGDIATLYLDNQRMEQARIHAEKALALLPYQHCASGKAHRVLAFVYFERGDREKGRRHLEQAMQVFERHDQLAQLNEITLQLCHHLEECGQTHEAFQRLENFYTHMMKKLEERGILL